jgi:uncharacterized membrane protein HdeD (DUF308 family)
MPTSNASQKSNRSLLLIGGILSILVGFLAISTPVFFTELLTIFLGAFCLVGGVIGLFQALFGKETPHRILSALSAVIRIAAGAALFFFTGPGMLALTLVIAVVFLIEGVVCIITSLGMRSNPAWIWLFLNGIAALVLGGMLYAQWPGDSAWVIGILYGIQSLFTGSAMLMLGIKGSQA